MHFTSLLKEEVINDINKVRPEVRNIARLSKKNIHSLQEETHLGPRPESVSGVEKKKKKIIFLGSKKKKKNPNSKLGFVCMGGVLEYKLFQDSKNPAQPSQCLPEQGKEQTGLLTAGRVAQKIKIPNACSPFNEL